MLTNSDYTVAGSDPRINIQELRMRTYPFLEYIKCQKILCFFPYFLDFYLPYVYLFLQKFQIEL
jgi:hypothetical protein